MRALGSPFAFPAGFVPGVDFSHVAAAGMGPGTGLSAVPSGNNFINLLNGNKGTVVGSGQTANVKGILGPCAGFPTATNGINTFPNSNVTTKLTYAVIGAGSSFAAAQPIISQGNNNNMLLWDASAHLQFIFNGGELTVGPNQSANAPFFFAISVFGNGTTLVINSVFVDLTTGKITTSVLNPTGNLNSSITTIYLGNRSDGAIPMTGFMGPVMVNPSVFLSIPQLLVWAVDPWSFWYPSASEESWVGSSGALTAALLACAGVMVRSKIGFTGALAANAKGSAMLFARPSPAGTVPLLGRATAEAMAKAQASGAAPMAGKSAAQARAKAAPTGAAAMAARAAIDGFSKAQPSGVVSLLARAVAAVKSQATLTPAIFLAAKCAAAVKALAKPVGAAAMSARASVSTQAKASASGVVGLAVKSAAMVRAVASIGTGGFVALLACVGLMAKAAGSPVGKAAMAATAATQTKVQAAPSGKVGLLAKAATQVKAFANLNLITSLQALAALSGAAVKARAGLTGTAPLSGASKLQAKAPSLLVASAALAGRAGTSARAKASATYGLALYAIVNSASHAKASAVGVLRLSALSKVVTAVRPALSGFVPFVAVMALGGVAVKARAGLGFIITPVAERTIALYRTGTIALERTTTIALQRITTLIAKW